MAKSKHSIYSASSTLNRKNDVHVSVEHMQIQLLSDISKNKRHDLGNKSWGKIDFLRKSKFKVYYVEKIDKNRVIIGF